MQLRANRATAASLFKPTILSLAIVGVLYGEGIQANPVGPSVVHGTVSIDQSTPGVTNITNSPNSVIHWQGFSIQQNEITRFLQQSSQSAVLNRVVGADPSQIMGQLLSNGQVFLINPNGILFGADSVIDTAGFIASTLNLSNEDFLSGNYHFIAGDNAGDIDNQGIIRTGEDGHIMLIAPNIKNSGILSTEGGKITLAAGEELTITSLDDPRIRFQVQAPDHEVLNVGEVLTNGGAAGLFAGTITHSGAINANTVEIDEQGQVWLVAKADITLGEGSTITASNTAGGDGGEIHIQATGTGEEGEVSVVAHQGSIEAQGQSGGSVTIEADSMFSSDQIDVSGEAVGGNVTVNLKQRLLATEDSVIRADATTGSGGVIDVRADGRIFTSAQYSATGGNGGGDVVITAPEVKLVSAEIDVSGGKLGGDIRIGGGFKGEDTTIANATDTYVNATTTLAADATQAGDGGTVVVWADGVTKFGGRISATGGAESGDGGSAEVSGKGELGYNGIVDLSAANGEAGTLLLDPANLTIVESAATTLTITELLDPNPGAFDRLGQNRQTLSNGYLAFVQPEDDFGGADAGALYVFNPDSGALAYSLTGANAGDQIGWNNLDSVTGGYVLRSPLFNSFTGAITFFTAATGVNGVISTLNSLTGAQAGDAVGGAGLINLSGGHYLLNSGEWGNNQGAWTWLNTGSNLMVNGQPIAGVVNSSNSLIGGTGGDSTSAFGFTQNFGSGITGLFVPGWDSAFTDAGSFTLFNANTGQFLDGADLIGGISASNSLVGSGNGDMVGYEGAYSVGGGYMLMSPHWGGNQGAWTWFDPLSDILIDGNPVEGLVSASNSLVGGTGDLSAPTAAYLYNLGSSRYALINYQWDDAGTQDAGAVTFIDGITGRFLLDNSALAGIVSSSNSLVGSSASDQVGSQGLDWVGGNYMLLSPNWGSAQGAWTWIDVDAKTLADGSSFIGTISSSNSLVGGTAASGLIVNPYPDHLGSNIYVLNNYGWDSATNMDAGAVTLFNGATGQFLDLMDFVGTISNNNSLVGSSANDLVGYGGIENAGSNYIVMSPYWGNNQGAWTWIDPINDLVADQDSSITGFVDQFNSLIGGNGGDPGGSFADLYSLTGSKYGLFNRYWDDASAVNAGAITLFNADLGVFLDGSPLLGLINSSNSLVGSLGQDRVGNIGPSFLGNNNFLLSHPYWGNNQGAWTWINLNNDLLANGQAINGVVGAGNSLIGGTGGFPSGSFAYLSNLGSGNYLLINSYWDGPGAQDAGAATIFDATAGKFLDGSDLVGTISSVNSLVGNTAFDRVGEGGRQWVGGGYLLVSPHWGNNQGAVTWFNPATGLLATGQAFNGVLSSANSLIGGTGGDANGVYFETYNFGSSKYLLYDSEWDAPGAVDAGFMTVIDGLNGDFINGTDLVGTISSSNSLIGSSANDRVGIWGASFGTGGAIVESPYWGDGQGAWTWIDDTNYLLANGQSVTGVISAANSLVGGTAGDTNGASSYISYFDNNLVALFNEEWDASGATDAGSVTFFNEQTGLMLNGSPLLGTISSSNSLVGSNTGDRIGYDWDSPSQNILILSPNWGNNQGAITWVNETTATLVNGASATGVISTANSLVGGTGGDANPTYVEGISSYGSNMALIRIPEWDASASAFDAGAAIMFNPTAGTFLDGSQFSGTISAANSLVGSSLNDRVGYYWPWSVGGGEMLRHPYWGDNQGAWTWFDSTTGLLANGQAFKGVLSSTNSLIGGTGGDVNGSFANFWNAGNGNYFLYNNGWDGPGAQNAGAVTVFNGDTGSFIDGSDLVGVISGANSIVGERPSDFLSSGNIQTLISGQRFAVYSPFYDSATASDVGRVFLIDLTEGGESPTSDLLFSSSPSSDVNVTRGSVEATLDTGTNLLLQANNDLTVAADIQVDEGGAGGDLTLQAGRSLFVNADIFTDNGDLTLVANDENALQTNRSAGQGQISVASGTVLNSGSGDITLRIGTGPEAGDINIAGSLLSTVGDITLHNMTLLKGINLLSSAIVDAGNSGTTGESTVLFMADSLAIAAGALVHGQDFDLRPTSLNYDLGLAGGSGALNLTEAELNALDFSQSITLNSGILSGDINIGSFTATQSPSFYRFYARDGLTVSGGISVPNWAYLTADYNDNGVNTMDLNGGFSGNFNLYSATGTSAQNDLLLLPDSTNTLTPNGQNMLIDLGGATGTAFRFGDVVGGSGADTFNLSSTNILTSISGGGGSDTFDYTGYSAPMTVDLLAGTAPNVAVFSSIENFIGGSGDDIFLLNNSNYVVNSIVGAGGTDTVNQTAGTLNLTGMLDAEIVTMNGGTFGGVGTIVGDIMIDGGTMSVGNSPGQLTIIGNYTQTANSTFLAELGGTDQGVSYDFLDVTGTVTLDGALDVVLFGGYQPLYQDSFTLINSQSGNIVGDFSSRALPAGFDWGTGVNGPAYQMVNNSVTATSTVTSTQTSEIVSLTEQSTLAQTTTTTTDTSSSGESLLVDATQTTEPTLAEIGDELVAMTEENPTAAGGTITTSVLSVAGANVSDGDELLETDLYPPVEEPISKTPLPDLETVTIVEAIEALNTGDYTYADKTLFYYSLSEEQVVEGLLEAGETELSRFFASTAIGMETNEAQLIEILTEQGATDDEKISYLGLFARMRHIGMSRLLAEALRLLRLDPDMADVFDDGAVGEEIGISLNRFPQTVDGLATLDGKLRSDSKMLYLGVNQQWVFVDESGGFKATVPLQQGYNQLELSASDIGGASASTVIPVSSEVTGELPKVEGRRIALFIGVEEYDGAIPELDTPVNDARAVAEKMSAEHGFDTRLLENPTKQQILDSLKQLSDEVQEGDSLVVYYAGHGYQLKENGRGYWLPRDADTDTPVNWVSNRDIARLFHRTPAKQIMLVSDSCYSGTFTKGREVSNIREDDVRWLRAVMAMSSGGEQPVWDGGGDGHSVFAAKLLDSIENEEIQGAQFYRRVRDKVVQVAPQIPGYGAMVMPGYDEGADYQLKPSVREL